MIHSWYISPASHEATAVSCPLVSFPLSLPVPCCQLPRDICSHPLLNEKVLMHDFRICQNTAHLQVFAEAANLTTRKRNEKRKSSFLAKERGWGEESRAIPSLCWLTGGCMTGRGPSLIQPSLFLSFSPKITDL